MDGIREVFPRWAGQGVPADASAASDGEGRATGGRMRSVVVTAEGQPMTIARFGAAPLRHVEAAGAAFGWTALVARFDPTGGRPFSYVIPALGSFPPAYGASKLLSRRGLGRAGLIAGFDDAPDTFKFRTRP